MEDVNPAPRFALWLPVVVLWLLGAIPIAVWAGMFAHAIRTWRFLGRWPVPGNPDPRALPAALQAERIEAFVIGAIIALVIVAGVGFTRRSSWRVRFLAALAGAIVLWTLWFAVSRIDPGRVVEWYLAPRPHEVDESLLDVHAHQFHVRALADVEAFPAVNDLALDRRMEDAHIRAF